MMLIDRRNLMASIAAVGTSFGWAAPSLAKSPPLARIEWDRALTKQGFNGTGNRLMDKAVLIEPYDVTLKGWLGERVSLNESNRLMHVDLTEILAGYRKKPGAQAWVGEHIGKWIHAATLAWAKNGDVALKQKLDQGVKDLILTQEPDGYLGTYLPDQRMSMHPGTGWDVWSFKYNMIGLLTYYRYTHNEAALAAAEMMAQYLIKTFPEKRSILKAGEHKGMAATSVLEPMVMLYGLTGNRDYARFCAYLVASWQEVGGPDIIRNLFDNKKVARVSNGKAYELLSNLVGLCAWAKVTGDETLIKAIDIGWNDIVATQLHVTGTTSFMEYFQSDEKLAVDNQPQVGENCVTVTWIQLNQALLALTGDARFARELERTYYNALASAQHPNGEDWCYFSPLNGKKVYDKHVTCCHSSGPRGMALAPLSAYLKGRKANNDMVMITSFETSKAQMRLSDQDVTIDYQSDFPKYGQGRIRFEMDRSAMFGVKILMPEWARGVRLKGAVAKDGWLEIAPKLWRPNEAIEMQYQIASFLHAGSGVMKGQHYQAYGPFVLAVESHKNPTLASLDKLVFAEPAKLQKGGADKTLRFSAKLSQGDSKAEITLSLYGDAGTDGGEMRVWQTV